jgi:hypothetical protein
MKLDGAVVMIVGPTTATPPVTGPRIGEVIAPVPPHHGVAKPPHPGATMGKGTTALAVDTGAAVATALSAAATPTRRLRVGFI